eukprot:TRINITY_DN41715_c0_g1_i2.p1 TRINITY_DN41715_c0_g1~~TRINITY_DN41715_c0_g1_i2.p1  ORF type:complete len:438 (-),score=103.11 TRINITY_DN41715_c0_g1_i2:60-1307(-)
MVGQFYSSSLAAVVFACAVLAGGPLFGAALRVDDGDDDPPAPARAADAAAVPAVSPSLATASAVSSASNSTRAARSIFRAPIASALLEVLKLSDSTLVASAHRAQQTQSPLWNCIVFIVSALAVSCCVGALAGLCPRQAEKGLNDCRVPVRAQDISTRSVPTRYKTVRECLNDLEGSVRTILEEDRRAADWSHFEAPDESPPPAETAVEKCKAILDIYDADKDGYLTFQEAQQFEADIGDDLDVEEYRKLCATLNVDPRRGLDHSDLLKIYEGNETHLAADYEAIKKKTATRNQKRKVEAIHKYFDKDRDGYLNLTEMQALCSARSDRLNKEEFAALCLAFGSSKTASAGLGPQALLKIYKELNDSEELDSDFCEVQRHRRPSVDATSWRMGARKRRLVEALQRSSTARSSSGRS